MSLGCYEDSLGAVESLLTTGKGAKTADSLPAGGSNFAFKRFLSVSKGHFITDNLRFLFFCECMESLRGKMHGLKNTLF